MRHLYLRGILTLIWLIAALISGISGGSAMTAFYLLMGGIFLYSTISLWKKRKEG